MDESLARLAHITSWSDDLIFRSTSDFKDPWVVNANRDKPRVPVAIRRKLEAANWVDMRLYEYAVQLFLRQQH